MIAKEEEEEEEEEEEVIIRGVRSTADSSLSLFLSLDAVFFLFR